MEIIIGIVWIVVVLGLIYMTMYNSLIGAKNAVENNKGTIETVLQNRYDLIPNLVEVVKNYTKHEKDTLKEVIEMRNAAMSNQSVDANSAQQENALSGTLKSIFALSENYPDLKADTSFINLQNQLTELEDRLQAARRGYNYAVTTLRNKKEMFPSNIVAGGMNLPSYDLFDAQDEADKVVSIKDAFDS